MALLAITVYESEDYYDYILFYKWNYTILVYSILSLKIHNCYKSKTL